MSPGLGENNLALYFCLDDCANAVPGNCGAKTKVSASSAKMDRWSFIFSFHPGDYKLSITLCGLKTFQPCHFSSNRQKLIQHPRGGNAKSSLKSSLTKG